MWGIYHRSSAALFENRSAGSRMGRSRPHLARAVSLPVRALTSATRGDQAVSDGSEFD